VGMAPPKSAALERRATALTHASRVVCCWHTLGAGTLYIPLIDGQPGNASVAHQTPCWLTGLGVGVVGDLREGEKGDSAVVPFFGDSGGCSQARRMLLSAPGSTASANGQLPIN
jgi:hypothetical protein